MKCLSVLEDIPNVTSETALRLLKAAKAKSKELIAYFFE